MGEAHEHHELRLRLESHVVGECSECGRPITALDAACRNEVREPDGEEWVMWSHASCLGCEETETGRWTGCDICERSWVRTVEPQEGQDG